MPEKAKPAAANGGPCFKQPNRYPAISERSTNGKDNE